GRRITVMALVPAISVGKGAALGIGVAGTSPAMTAKRTRGRVNVHIVFRPPRCYHSTCFPAAGRVRPAAFDIVNLKGGRLRPPPHPGKRLPRRRPCMAAPSRGRCQGPAHEFYIAPKKSTFVDSRPVSPAETHRQPSRFEPCSRTCEKPQRPALSESKQCP